MKRLATVIILICICTACAKNEAKRTDSFAFGHSFCECEKECNTLFQIRNNHVYPDDMHKACMETPKFSSQALDDDKYQLALKVKNQLPQYLFDHPNCSFGCPDCRDQGSIKLYMNNDRQALSWTLDTDTSELPQEIRQYVVLVEGTIGQLQ